MTGEITLTGRVLAIGGLREKSMAAYRNGIKTVIIPAANEKDVDEFSPTVKNAIRFVPVKTIDEVFRIAFANPPKPVRAAKEKAGKKEDPERENAAPSTAPEGKPEGQEIADEVKKDEV